jgi:hypothetical protein
VRGVGGERYLRGVGGERCVRDVGAVGVVGGRRGGRGRCRCDLVHPRGGLSICNRFLSEPPIVWAVIPAGSAADGCEEVPGVIKPIVALIGINLLRPH